MWRFFCLLLLVGCSGGQPHFPGHSFLGAPYMESPLGEEVLPDTDPLIRFDAFDCTTFVETALADGDSKSLQRIRYKDGKIGFLTRNHFIESDWLQNNKKWAKNVSQRFAPTKIRNVVIDKKSWLKKIHNIDADITPTEVNLEYIPYENAKNIVVKQPMIVLFITDNPKIRDKIGTDLAVVHMGFLLPNGILRHASSEQGAVVDAPWSEYVAARQKNKNNLGITLVEVK